MNIDSMIQGNPQALVTSYNGVLVADSLEVADRFGKAHKNVVRDIENLMDGTVTLAEGIGKSVIGYGYYTSYNGTKWLYIQVTLNGVQYTGFSCKTYLKKQ